MKSYQYILSKLHYNNVFNDAFLRSLYIARLGILLIDELIPKLVNDKIIVIKSEAKFNLTSIYLQQAFPS